MKCVVRLDTSYLLVSMQIIVFVMALKRKRKSGRIDWEDAPDIKSRIQKIIKSAGITWVDPMRIYCYRSRNSSSRAYARIWGLSNIWQLALKQDPAYVIEVLSEKFDHLPQKQKDEILIHELAHIPRNFSGSLLPHVRKRGKRNFEDRVRVLVNLFKNTIS